MFILHGSIFMKIPLEAASFEALGSVWSACYQIKTIGKFCGDWRLDVISRTSILYATDSALQLQELLLSKNWHSNIISVTYS